MARLVILLLLIFAIKLAYGQDRWLAGLGFMYCSYVKSPGVNASVSCRLTRNLYVGPDFSALFSRELAEGGHQVKRKEVEFNFNAHRTFDVRKGIVLYPLAGINLSKVTHHISGESAVSRYQAGFNTGGGIEWSFTGFRLFVEGKYVVNRSKADITGGILLRL